MHSFERIRKMISGRIERSYRLELMLHGINDIEPKFVFNPLPSLDPRNDKESDKIHVETVISKINAGIIDIDTAARELGYDKATGIPVVPIAPSQNGDDYNDDNDSEDESLTLVMSSRSIIGLSRESDKLTAKYLREYFNEMSEPFLDLFGKPLRNHIKEFVNRYANTSAEMEAVALDFWESLKNKLILPASEKVASRVEGRPGEMFEGFKDEFQVELKLSQPDLRAIEFVNMFDNYIVMTFVDSQYYSQTIQNWITTEFLENGESLFGAYDERVMQRFIDTFSNRFRDFTIRRVRNIVNTTVSRSRNWAHISQMFDAGITTYQYWANGPNPCEICLSLDGRTYSVRAMYEHVQRFSGMAADEYMQTLTGHQSLRSQLLDPASPNPTDYEMESAGFPLPPTHTNCECDIKSDV